MALYFRMRVPIDLQEAKFQLTMEDPTGKRQSTPEIPVSISNNRSEGQIQLQGLPLPAYGLYRFELSILGKHVGTFTITVVQTGAPQDAAASAH
jgi:hypothetical protein